VFRPWTAPTGVYTLKATAFSETRAGGTASAAFTITFRVV
jgi:hypothetical protein